MECSAKYLLTDSALRVSGDPIPHVQYLQDLRLENDISFPNHPFRQAELRFGVVFGDPLRTRGWAIQMMKAARQRIYFRGLRCEVDTELVRESYDCQ